jgi:hypothetical protein
MLTLLSGVGGILAKLIGGPFVQGAVDAYKAKLAAGQASDVLAADLATKEIALNQRESELRTQVNLSDGNRWFTAAIRPLFALPFIIYLFKVIVWDKVFGWGVTDPLSKELLDVFKTVLSFYFVGRSVEKVAQIVSRGLPGSSKR